MFALLNLWFRERQGLALIANDEDIHEAFKIWDVISESQELNLPPYVYNLYKDVIVSAYKDKNSGMDGVVNRFGLTRQEIFQKHYKVYGRFLPDWQFRQEILPILETSGLITQEANPTDKRQQLIYPTSLTIAEDKTNSELEGGVNEALPLTEAEKYFVELADTES